jgi:hypothetical protein
VYGWASGRASSTHAVFVCRLFACASMRHGPPQVPFPIMRALSIILTRRCEFCGEKRVRYLKDDFRVFAHDKCFEAQLRWANGARCT